MDRTICGVRNYSWLGDDIHAENKRLRAELAQCRKDAERYRAVRDIFSDEVAQRKMGIDGLSGDDLDAAIDAAMQGEK